MVKPQVSIKLSDILIDKDYFNAGVNNHAVKALHLLWINKSKQVEFAFMHPNTVLVFVCTSKLK